MIPFRAASAGHKALHYVQREGFHFKVLYTGVTNNLVRRVFEHKTMQIEGFTQKYGMVQTRVTHQNACRAGL